MTFIDLLAARSHRGGHLSCGGLPMWVQALAVAAGAVAVAGLGHVPVAVAVGSVAVLAESCIIVEPGRVDLGEAEGRPERLCADVPRRGHIRRIPSPGRGSRRQRTPTCRWCTAPPR